MGAAAPYSGLDEARFKWLRSLEEAEWRPGMAARLGLGPADLPAVWDADFLLGLRNAACEGTYVLCEINASSVYPILDEAHAALAASLRWLAQTRAR